MKSLFSRWFGARPQSRRPIRRQSIPLGVEVLDQRILMSVTPTLTGGQLQLVSNGNDNVTVTTTSSTLFSLNPFSFPSTNRNVNVDANFADGSTTKSWPLSSVQSLMFQANGGTDVFTNGTFLNATFHGENGSVTMYGGSGQNTYFVNGNDTINPHGPQNITYGLLNNLTPAELSAQGTLGASLSSDNTTLTLSGPSGEGFKLAGTWTDTQTSTQEIFKATGTVTFESALGNIPFPTGMLGVTVTTAADGASKSGPVASVNLTGLPDLNVNNSGPFQALSNDLGLTVTLPNISWGLQLGSNLTSTGLPLDSGVPYLYLNVSTGFSVAFGSANLSSDAGKNLAIAVDPADPSVFINYGSFTVGGSMKGYIPFTPVSQPDAITNTLYGNLYGSGQISFDDPPISITGSAVINLDANHTGHPLGISGNTFSQVLAGKASLKSLAATALDDIAVGVNGTVSLGFDQDGFNLSVPVGNATLMYVPSSDPSTPSVLAFDGSQPNLFAGTPLDNLFPKALQNVVTPPRYSVDASISWDSSGVQDWHVTAAVDNLVLGGSFTATHAQITIDNTGVHANASISGLFGLASINLTGDINSDGSFDLQTTGNASLDAGVTTFHAGFTFDLTHSGSSTSLSASVSGSFDSFSVGVGSVSGSASGNISLTYERVINFASKSYVNTLEISGGATATLTYTHGSDTDNLSIGFTFNNSGFTIDTPWPLPNITVGWSGVVYDDLNGNGVRDVGDPGLSGYKVFLDLNNNGRLDKGEPVAVSDATGAYSFGQLPDVPFIARVILPNGNVALTDPFANDVFNPASGENMQYHFGIKAVNAAGQKELAATLQSQLTHQTASVAFWNSKNGQALIDSLNGGTTSTQLGAWLAATLPDLYGDSAGTNDLSAMTNAQVAQFYQQLIRKGQTLDAQVLATALSVYVTDSNLAGTAATKYGFHIIGGGAGAMGFNVGNDGAAVGSANSSVLSIMDILQATDQASVGANGTLYAGNAKLRSQALALFGAINKAGGI